jgi:Zn-dependent protease
VAAAGPLANISLVFILTVAFHLFHLSAIPLLGSFVLLAIFFNIILAVFNLIPIPPLDGSKMVYASLQSPQAINMYQKFSRFGMFVLIIGIIFLDGFERVILPLVDRFFSILGLP